MRYEFLVDTYATERLKALSVWSMFEDDDLTVRPHPRTARDAAGEHMVHQCMSENLWFPTMFGIDVGAPPLPSGRPAWTSSVATRRTPGSDSTRCGQRTRLVGGRGRLLRHGAQPGLDHGAEGGAHRPSPGEQTTLLRLLGQPVHSVYGPASTPAGCRRTGRPRSTRTPTSRPSSRASPAAAPRRCCPVPVRSRAPSGPTDSSRAAVCWGTRAVDEVGGDDRTARLVPRTVREKTVTQMRYRVLGSSGVKVSEICLGTMLFGGQTDAAQARRIIDHAADNGVNFIDTANVYAEGRSETVIGPAIKATRDRWVLATKVAQATGPGVTDRGLSRRHLMQAVDASLDAPPDRPHRPLLHPPGRPRHRLGADDRRLRRPDPPGEGPRVGAVQRASPGTSRTCITCAGSSAFRRRQRSSPTTTS